MHGGRRLDDEIIGVDVRSQRVDDVVKGSLVRFIDVPRDSVKVVEDTRGEGSEGWREEGAD